jgi:tRNA-dihydrouridine synthase B
MSPDLPWRTPYLLAPMAGLTTTGVRSLFFQWGAGAMSTGLLDAEGLAKRRPGSLRRAEASTPHQIVQFFGNDPKYLALAAASAEERGFAGVELNLGCPAPVVLKRGCGAALMGNPSLVSDLLIALREATSLPIGLKCRSGLQTEDNSYLAIYDAAVKAKLDWFALHPRSLREGYTATPHWDLLNNLPADGPALITGGSLQTAAQVRHIMNSYPHVQACYIGRPAFTRPWIFEELLGQPTPEIPKMAEHILSILSELASDLDQSEASRILPVLLRLFGLEPSGTPQLDLIQPKVRLEMRDQVENRLNQSPFPEIQGNPFLRSS